jgi:hypothetical protein
MPVHRFYESVVTAPDAVYAAMDAMRLHTTSRYATRAEAIAGHRQVVTRIGMLVQALKVSA